MWCFNWLKKKSKEYFKICKNYLKLNSSAHKVILEHCHAHTCLWIVSGCFFTTTGGLSRWGRDYMDWKARNTYSLVFCTKSVTPGWEFSNGVTTKRSTKKLPYTVRSSSFIIFYLPQEYVFSFTSWKRKVYKCSWNGNKIF